MIESKINKDDYLLIGVDESNGEDYSCIAYYCAKCHTVFDMQEFKPDEELRYVNYKKCKQCGIEFKKSRICK